MGVCTTAQSLGALLKSARDVIRMGKRLNGDLDRPPMLTYVVADVRRLILKSAKSRIPNSGIARPT